MFTYDSEQRKFLSENSAFKDTVEANFLPQEHNWWYKILFNDFSPKRWYLDPAPDTQLSPLSEVNFAHKNVLNFGCREGFFAFYAEAKGANKILAADFQERQPQYEECFKFLKASLASKAELKYIRGKQYSQLESEKFDIVILSDLLSFVSDPHELLEWVKTVCREELIIYSYFFNDNNDIPISVLLRAHSPKPCNVAKYAFNLSWFSQLLAEHKVLIKKASLCQNRSYICILSENKNLPETKKISYQEMPLDDSRVNDTAVLVMSCKKFAQVWDPFFILFKRYWPDCPYRIYFCTDSGQYPGVETIEIGRDLGWADNCKYALERINAKRILLFQEDFLLNDRVDSVKVRKYVEHAHAFEVGCLRLMPCPGASAVWHATDELGVISPTDDYRLSMQLALWKKELLQALLISGESPWQIEIEGTKRAALRPDIFLSTWSVCPVPYYVTAVVKGEWQDDALKLLDREGIPTSHINKKVY